MAQQQSKRERHKEGHRARQAAVMAARKRRARRRMALRVLLVLLVVGGVVAGIVALQGADEEEEATEDTTTTTAALGESAAGKPCVPVADPLPSGAPEVPVKVGPPPTTLIKEDLKVGTGPVVAATSTVTVNYIGVSCSTGKIFDASYTRGEPISFPLSGVIKGWTDGLQGMNAGGQRLLGIPPEQAYGPTGRPPNIAPDETLWFVVEVLNATG